MEFHIATHDMRPDLDAIQDTLFDIDSNAMVDLDANGATLRISSFVTIADLIEVLRRTGWNVGEEQVEQMPTICCGGCAG